MANSAMLSDSDEDGIVEVDFRYQAASALVVAWMGFGCRYDSSPLESGL